MEVDVEELRRLSRAAFNQAYRLEVMLFIADSDGFVTQTEVAQGLGLRSVSNVQAPIRSLIECGLLNPMPKTDNRSRFLARSDSPAWDWARQLRGMAAELPTVPSRSSSRT
ncbi:MAG: MarR family transcriptional regulator [Nocardioides sp.]